MRLLSCERSKIREVLQYELPSVPLSLFERNVKMGNSKYKSN